jgi:hypothetical protein
LIRYELPHELQSKLLRVLQEGQFERGGDDKTYHSASLPALASEESSNRGHSSAVNDIFRAGDGGSPRRGEEGDELRYFFRPGRAPDRNAAERVHQYLAAAILIPAPVRRQLVD